MKIEKSRTFCRKKFPVSPSVAEARARPAAVTAVTAGRFWTIPASNFTILAGFWLEDAWLVRASHGLQLGAWGSMHLGVYPHGWARHRVGAMPGGRFGRLEMKRAAGASSRKGVGRGGPADGVCLRWAASRAAAAA